MNGEMKVLYRYCCGGSLPKISLFLMRRDIKRALNLYEEYRYLRGKFFCNHQWQLFTIVPSGTFAVYFGTAKCICEKCGKVSYDKRCRNPDDRLIDCSSHVVYG